MEGNTVFDMDEMLKSLDGDEAFLRELVEILINDTPEQLSRIKEAVNSCNSTELEKSAHKLKGAISNFGERAAYKTALKLEIMGRDNRLDGVQKVYDNLLKEVEYLVNALKVLVK